MRIILASQSTYRRQLMQKLAIPFDWVAADVDEQAKPGESAPQLVKRLARLKARSVAEMGYSGLIIGSDQVAVAVDNRMLGKPGSRSGAIRQLQQCQGSRVRFYTGLCLLNTDRVREQCCVSRFDVHFRELGKQQIEAYVDRDKPLDCAGSFKSEGLGIALFSKMTGDDPNSLIGLPLIRLVQFLANEGVDVLTAGKDPDAASL